MAIKAKGICPYCQETVNALVIKESTVRRDKCQCPKCKESMYVCRAPGCDNYVKNGKVYDDELCPSCTKGLVSTVGSLGMVAATTVISIVVAKKFDK
jgi:hypothetical protein